MPKSIGQFFIGGVGAFCLLGKLPGLFLSMAFEDVCESL
jgi:hypothetical protein